MAEPPNAVEPAEQASDPVEQAKQVSIEEIAEETASIIPSEEEESAFVANQYRLGKVEGQLESVATKAELADIKTEISNLKLWAALIFAGFLTTLLSASLGANVALARLFLSLLADVLADGLELPSLPD